MKTKSVADIMGPWEEPDFDSSLIDRCRRFWNIPASELPAEILATFLRQRMALEIIIPEAKKRIESGIHDNSELYDGELEEALKGAQL